MRSAALAARFPRELLALVLLPGGLAAAAALAFAPSRAATPAFWLLLVGAYGAASAFAARRLAWAGELRGLFRPVWGDFSRAFFVAVLLYGAAAVFRRFALPPGSPQEGWLVRLYLHLGDPREIRAHVGLFAAALVVIVVGEELVFRAYLPGLLEPRLGSRRALFVSAALYAAVQIPAVFLLRDGRAGPNPLLFLAAAFVGLVLGVLVRSSGRLLPAVLAHGLFAWAVTFGFPLWGFRG